MTHTPPRCAYKHPPSSISVSTSARAATTACTSSAALFEPLALSDAIEVSEAERDKVVCPGVGGDNLAARALTALREPAGSTRRCGWRSRSGSRSPPASAAAAPTPPRCWGSRAADASRCPTSSGSPRSWAPTCPRSSPRPRPRAGRRQRVERLPAPASPCGPPPTRRRRSQHRRGLRRGGPARARSRRGGAGRARGRLRQAAGTGASPLDYADLLANDLEPAARSLRPDVGDALDALREAGAPLAFLTGSGPTAVGLFPDLGGASRPQRGSTATTRSSAGRAKRREDAVCRRTRRRKRLLIPVFAAAIAAGYYLLSRATRHLDLQSCSKTSPTRSAPGPTCWSASSPSPRPAPSSASSSPARR